LKFIIYRLLLISLAVLAGSVYAFGQATIVRGEIRDAKTGQPLQLITVQASAIGYKTVAKNIIPGREQTINFVLSADNKQLNEVVVRAGKKPKYRNRDNPAVEVIRQVIAHKKLNRVE